MTMNAGREPLTGASWRIYPLSAFKAIFAFLVLAAVVCGAHHAAAQVSGASPTPSPLPATTSSGKDVEKWRAGMKRAIPPREGCFTSSYPNAQWNEIPCKTAPAAPYPRALGRQSSTVGSGNDAAACVGYVDVNNNCSVVNAPTPPISEAVGSFDSVSGVTFEYDSTLGIGPGTNSFSLQLNTNTFNTPACGGVTGCFAWQQFLYTNGTNAGGVNSNGAFIQYWLFNLPKCPNAQWTYYDGPGEPGCYQNTGMVSVPEQAITSLINFSLTGAASAGSIDSVAMAVGGDLFVVNHSDSQLYLAQDWIQAEFNVVGNCCSSRAVLQNGGTGGTTVVVRTSVDNGVPFAPACISGANGFTAETNNLGFASTSMMVQMGSSPAIVFTESSVGGASSP
jgi:hypothetical protein